MRRIACIVALAAVVAAGIGAQEAGEVRDLGQAVVVGDWAPSELSPTAATVVIDAEELATAGASTLAELLDGRAGLEVREYGYPGSAGSLSIRGGTGGHVVVVVDGVRLNDARTGYADLSSVSLAGVESVEVLRGGASALYGADAIAGVVYVTTARAGDDSFSATISTTAYPLAAAEGERALLASQELSFAALKAVGAATLSVSGNLERAADELPVADETGYAVRENTGLLAGRTSLGVAAPILGGTFTASASGSVSDKGVPGSVSYISPSANQKEYSARGVVGWGTDEFVDGNASVDADLSASWSRLNYVDPDGWPSGTDDAHDSLGGAANLRSVLAVGPAIVRAGLTGGVETAASSAIGERSRLSAGAYATPELALGDVTVAPSLRYDLYSDYAAGLSYGMGVSWRRDAFALRANGASSYKAPSFNDLYWPDDGFTVGNAALKAERGWSAELGAEYSTEAFSVGAYPFFRYVRDMIAWAYSTETFMYSPSNVETAAYAGADLSTSASFGPWSAEASYSLTLARDLSGGESFSEAAALAFVPAHSVGAEIGYSAGAARASVSASWKAGRVDAAAEALPDLLLLGAAAEWEALDGYFVGLRLDNLLDEAYYEYAGYPMPGLSATIYARLER